ncbi:hypothetical protein MMC26_004764 [Xylographa opegraphella]|nr:hypothetical protein [Xylographa opegraphella]
MKKLTRTDGFVTVESFVGIVIGTNIVVFAGVPEMSGEFETKEVEDVPDGVELPSGVLDITVEEIMVVDEPDMVKNVVTPFEVITELLAVVLDLIIVVSTPILASALIERVDMSFGGSAGLVVGTVVIVAELLLEGTARLEVKADVIVIVLDDSADVIMAAVFGVAAAAEGKLTVMPDKLAHS